MSRIERLVNLLAALIDTDRPLSRAAIRERVPGYPTDEAAYRRSFERDKETLRNMGIPLVVEALDPLYPDHGEGYRVPPERYSLPDPGLTPAETQALAMAASAVHLSSQAAAAAVWKLGGDKNASTSDLAKVELTDDEQLGTLFSARSERRSASFDYRGTRRTVDPRRLSFRNGHWYLAGHDHGADGDRTYRLDRIQGEIELSEPDAFRHESTSSAPWLPAWQMGDGEPVTVEVLVDADQATIAVDQVGTDAVAETRTDGSIVLRMQVTNMDAVRSFVLGFLDHAEILAPDSARAAMVEYLQGLVKT